MKKLPTSVENFKELVKGDYYYVDKTLLIKDIVELSGKIKLITRPRRFGKTLNMDMMRRFFSMDEKENLFEGLKICNEKEIMKEHHHKYPVIYITFKTIKELTWKKAYGRIKKDFSRIAKEYIKWTKSGYYHDYLSKIINYEASYEDYESFLVMLTDMFKDEVGVPPIILIDEYDVPIESAYVNKDKDPQYYDNMIDFMRVFLTSALKGSDTYFSLAVLTGVYRIAKESIFSGLNNLAVYTVFDNQMSDKYGFTEDEVSEMLKHYGLGKEDKEIIDTWYGSYKVGKTENLYNPWSIVNYIAARVEGKLSLKEAAKKYWINTSDNKLIKDQIENNEEIHDTILVLLQGKEIDRYLDPALSLVELERKPSGVWVLFASAGYLSSRYDVDEDVYYLKIPNEELMRFFKESVMEWIEEKEKFNVSRLQRTLRVLLKYGEYEEFVYSLKEFVSKGFSFYDVARDEGERFYKGFLIGMLSIAVNGYKIESETETGYGRADVVVYPAERKGYAAIFEVKRSEDENKLKDTAAEALKQIEEKEYYGKMKSLGYEVIGFGIAFFGKWLRWRLRDYKSQTSNLPGLVNLQIDQITSPSHARRRRCFSPFSKTPHR